MELFGFKIVKADFYDNLLKRFGEVALERKRLAEKVGALETEIKILKEEYEQQEKKRRGRK